MLGERVREELRLHEGEAAAPAVEGVGARVRVADGVQPEHRRLAVVGGEPAAPVQQAGHHVHVGDRLGAVGLDVGPGRRDRRRGPHERVGVLEASAELGVAGVRREGHREGAAVTGEHAELQVLEVAADRADLRWVGGAVEEPEEPRQVDDPGVLRALGNLDPVRSQQRCGVAAPPVREHDQVRVQHGAVRQLDAGDRRRAGRPRIRTKAAHRHAVPQVGVTPQHGASQHPLEGGAATGERDQVLVARHGCVVHAVRQHRDEVERGGAGREQRVEHVGVAVPEQVPQPGEERVRVPDLRRAVSPPVERRVRVRGQRSVVALHERDLVPGSPGGQGHAEPRDPGAGHHDSCHESPCPRPPRRRRYQRRAAVREVGQRARERLALAPIEC